MMKNTGFTKKTLDNKILTSLPH